MSDTRNRYAPALLLALAITLGGGCKIVLKVPEGGSVTTETDTYSCAASQTCEIDVDDDSFDETFIAVPDEGYEFRGWKQQSPGLCQRELERLEPCSFSTVGYGLAPGLLDLLLEDIPVYLEPEFAPAAATELLFPSANSSAVDSSLTLRGTASDADGIAAVTVNGSRASIVPVEGSRTTNNGLYTDVSWYLPQVLEIGTNEFVVGVEDGSGSVNPSASTAIVQNISVPTEFFLDEVNQRLVGVVPGSTGRRELTSFDLNTKAQTLISSQIDLFGPYCHQSDTGEFFYLLRRSGRYELTSLNTETGAKTTWAVITIDLEAEGFHPNFFVLELVCEGGHDDVYMVYSFGPTETNILNDLTNSRILKFDLDAGEARLLEEFDTRKGDAATIRGAALMGDQLVVHLIDRAPKYSINTETGERTLLPVQNNLRVLELAPDAANNLLYIVNFEAIYQVDLTTGREQIVSFVPNDSPLKLTQPRSIILDTRNFRLLIGDSDLEKILQVSLLSGNRSEFLARRQGEGVSIVAGRSLYLTEDRSTAYVLDDVRNAINRLIEVDLATGNRREVGNLPSSLSGTVQALVVDEDAGLAYAASDRTVVQVDLETEQVVTLASSRVGFGPIPRGVSGLVLDKAGSRLLLSDSEEGAIMELALPTLVRTVFSQAGARGAGEPFAGISALAFDAENNRLYAANRQSRNIMSIDMESGDRTVILDSCPDTFGQYELGDFDALEGLLYRDGELLIRDLGLRRLNLITGKCAVLASVFRANVSVLGMQWLNEEVLLTSGLGGVGLYDTFTAQYVRVSE